MKLHASVMANGSTSSCVLIGFLRARRLAMEIEVALADTIPSIVAA